MKIEILTSKLDELRKEQLRKDCGFLSDWVKTKTEGGLLWDFTISESLYSFSVVSGNGLSGYSNQPTLISYIDPNQIPHNPNYDCTGLVYASEHYTGPYTMCPVETQGLTFQIEYIPGEDPNVFREFMCHEVLHKCFRLSGINDTVHQHGGLADPRPEANFSDCLNQLKPWWSKVPNNADIVTLTTIRDLLLKVLSLYQLLVSQKKSRINEWASAIKNFEGWYPGSRAYRNNNPGNLKFAGQKGTTGQDEQGHAIFGTYSQGWDALINQLTIAANGKSKIYKPTDTLLQFFQKYAEKNWTEEAESVSRELKVSVGIAIKDLL